MKKRSVIPLDVPGAHEQIKLCYAFVQSNHYYHQELSVINPFPTQFDPAHVFPRDLVLLFYHRDYDYNFIPLNDLISQAEKKKAPIRCIGSHRADTDRTIQLTWLPADASTDSQLIMEFIADTSTKEKQRIINDLLRTYRETNMDGDRE